MEVIAGVNLCVLAGVAVVATRSVRSQAQRRMLYLVCAFFFGVTLAGVVVNWLATNQMAPVDWSGALVWLVYIGGGIAVAVGIVAAVRGSGKVRWGWPQGRYQRYRSYRRI
jgi:hypothetical protein